MEPGIPSQLFAVTDKYEILKLKVESAELTNDVFKLNTSLMEGKYSDEAVLNYKNSFQYVYLNSDKSIHARHVSLFFDIKLARDFAIKKSESELRLLERQTKVAENRLAKLERELLKKGLNEEYIAQLKKEAIDEAEQDLLETTGSK
jgi:hypothetical protein